MPGADGAMTPFHRAASIPILNGMSTHASQADQPGRLASRQGAELDQRIRVLIADDHAAVRVGVCRLVGEQPDMRVVAAAISAIGAVTATAAAAQVAVIDYHLGDRNGLWVTRRLRQLDPPPRVLIYSAFTDQVLALTAIVAGADGLLSKSAIGGELCVAVRRLAAGQRYLPAISPVVIRAMSARLSPGQQPIFGMLVHGITPQLITLRLGITRSALEAERAAILAVLAPAATRARQPTATLMPLDYDRGRRSSRSRVTPRARS
jgi:two-component system response regulator DevR